jgi:hypothetical protein
LFKDLKNWKPIPINALFFALSLLLLIYATIRAILLPPYFDEISTFFFYVQKGDFIPFYARPDANNHFINSLLSYISYLVFGNSMFSLRLPSLLSLCVYLLFTWKIAKTFNSKYVGLSWFISLNFTLYMLSFFSITRGYSLSIAFLMASFYYLLKYSKSGEIKAAYFGLFFSTLSLWSNLSFMVLIIVYGLIMIYIYLKKEKNHLF